MRSLLVLLVLVLACQRTDDPRHTAERAAERVNKVTEVSAELPKLNEDFAREKRERLGSLRTMHSVIAAQPQLIERLAATTPLTDRARANLTEKLQIFQLRLDETGDAIESMVIVEAKDWTWRDSAVSDAMSRLVEARDAAWRAIIDGERIGSSS